MLPFINEPVRETPLIQLVKQLNSPGICSCVSRSAHPEIRCHGFPVSRSGIHSVLVRRRIDLSTGRYRDGLVQEQRREALPCVSVSACVCSVPTAAPPRLAPHTHTHTRRVLLLLLLT